MKENDLTRQIIGAAFKVHSNLGPGLLEQPYQVCLRHELLKQGMNALAEVGLPVVYDGVRIDIGYRLDLLVEDMVIVELKSVRHTAPIHRAQLLSYIKLSNKKVGLLINFNVLDLKRGIQRMVL